MKKRQNAGILIGAGAFLMLVALGLQFVTLAGQDYRVALASALSLSLIADLCLACAFGRGGFGARCLSILLMLPTIFIVADFLRRAPHAFR